MKNRILRKTWLKFCLFLLMVVISPHLFAQITVNEQNKPAIHLYEKLGFEKLGVRKKYYNNNNGIIMKKNFK